MMCTVCKRHRQRQRNGEYIWSVVPCTSLRKDHVLRHHKSEQHTGASLKDQKRLAAEVNGGIKQAMADMVRIKLIFKLF